MSNPEDDLRKAVLQYAQQRRKTKVGMGECWDLAHFALTDGAQAKSAGDYGVVTATSDYQWGKPVRLEDALPGDILQFKDHKAVLEKIKKIKITFPDSSWLEYVETEKRHSPAVITQRSSSQVSAAV
jgi:hypothetical protein